MERRARGEPLALTALSPLTHVVLAGLVATAWLATYSLGGSKSVGPHIFYIPIIWASIRLDRRAALAATILAGLAAGPLMPLDVATGTPQGTANWLVRLVIFVALGQATAFLVDHSTTSVRAELGRRWLRRELEVALANGHLGVEYQPIVDLSTRRIAGIEALVRWWHPTRGLIPPARFMPAIERAGVAPLVTRFVLQAACEQVSRWRGTPVLDGVDDFKVAVNLSGTELYDPGLEASVRGALARSDLPTSWLHLEVTETAVIEDLDAAVDGLRRLHRLGVGLAIDDFGTGQSSLSYLHRLPVDTLKVDRSFIQNMVGDRRGMLIVDSVVQLARALSLTTVAEGIETAEQASALDGVGFDLGQGFLFSRPRSANAMGELLIEDRTTGPVLDRPVAGRGDPQAR